MNTELAGKDKTIKTAKTLAQCDKRTRYVFELGGGFTISCNAPATQNHIKITTGGNVEVVEV